MRALAWMRRFWRRRFLLFILAHISFFNTDVTIWWKLQICIIEERACITKRKIWGLTPPLSHPRGGHRLTNLLVSYIYHDMICNKSQRPCVKPMYGPTDRGEKRGKRSVFEKLRWLSGNIPISCQWFSALSFSLLDGGRGGVELAAAAAAWVGMAPERGWGGVAPLDDLSLPVLEFISLIENKCSDRSMEV